MAADEEQSQNVVAIVSVVEALGQRALGVLGRGQRILGRQGRLLALPPHRIDGGVAADQDQPGGWIVGWALPGPLSKRCEAGLLKGFLGEVEVAEVAHECAHHAWSRRAQGEIDPAKIVHATLPPGKNTDTGRISYAPPGLAWPSSRTISRASSRPEHSMT